MKKFYPKILLFVLLLAVVFSPVFGVQKTEAQALEPLTGAPVTGLDLGDPFAGPSTVPANYVEQNPAQIPANTVTQGTDSPGAGAAKDAEKREPPKPPINASCIGFIPPSFSLDACAALIINFVMWIVSWFLYLAGFIFDQSMQFTLNISELMKSIPVVDIGWKIFRDLANVFFIFILLWIALSTILGLNSGKTKELIVHLVVVALLMNFSLFITKTIIDGSNIIALHFYNLIVNSQTTGANQIMTPQGSMSGAFMEGLKIQTLYDSRAIGEPGKERAGWGTRLKNAAINTVAGTITGSPVAGVVAGVATLAGGNVINWGKIILIGIFGSALMLIAAYVFLVGAVLMLIRAVVLMFVMMLSPLAFLAFAMPFAEKFVDPWKEALIKQCIFAPAFMTLSYVVVKTIQSPAFKGVTSITMGEASLATAFTTGAGEGITLIINFLLVIGLMLGCILVAKKLEVHGLEFAKTVGAKGAMWVASGRFITTTAGVVGYGFKGVSKSIQGFQQMPDTLKGWKDKGKAGYDKAKDALQNLPNTIEGGATKVGKMASNVLDRMDAYKAEKQRIMSGPGTDAEKKIALGAMNRRIIGEKLTAASSKASAFGAAVNMGAESLSKKFNVSEINKKFARSWFGTTELGNLIREQTTGRAVHAKFGGEESLEESYEASEKLKDKAQEVQRAEAVRKAAEASEHAVKMNKKEELLKRKPAVLPNKPDGTIMTEDEWLAHMKDEFEPERKRLLNAVQSAVVRLSSTGLVHLQEDVIKTVIPHATEKQVDELIKSTEGGWTQHDKEEFLEAYFMKLKDDGETCQAELEAFDEKLKAYEQKVRAGYFAIDSATGKVKKDKRGWAIVDGATIDATTGNASAAEEIPEYQQTEAFRAVYSKTRRFMSLKGFELLNITKFHFSDATRDRLAREGRNVDEGNLLRAVPAIGKIMKWSTSQDIRDPNKTSNFTDQERIDIRSIKDAELVELLTEMREMTDSAGKFMYRNTDDERATALQTGDFSKLTKDNMWEDRLREFLRGRAPVESANTPGSMRKNYEYARFMGAEALREFAKKDPIDVTMLLEAAFKAFKENEEGKRMMTFETKQLIKDLIQTKEGWKIGQKMRNVEFQQMRENLEEAFRSGKLKQVEFTDWTDSTQRTAALSEGLTDRFSRTVSRGTSTSSTP